MTNKEKRVMDKINDLVDAFEKLEKEAAARANKAYIEHTHNLNEFEKGEYRGLKTALDSLTCFSNEVLDIFCEKGV